MAILKDTLKDLFHLAYDDVSNVYKTLFLTTNKGTDEIVHSLQEKTTSIGDTVVTKQYNIPGYQNHKIQIDSILAFLPYGFMCSVIDKKGDFIFVEYKEDKVWIPIDSVTTIIEDVIPDRMIPEGATLQVSEKFSVAVRLSINDIFSMGQLGMSLQNVEYVWYRLTRGGMSFDWPKNIRPRQAGRWSSILRKQSSMYVGVVPMSGVVLECYNEKNQAQIFFVETVTPEEKIIVSGIEAESGQFSYFVDFSTICTPKVETVSYICQK